MQLDAKRLNTNNSAAFMNAGQETYFMVIAEEARGGPYKLDRFTDIVTAGLRRQARSLKVLNVFTLLTD